MGITVKDILQLDCFRTTSLHSHADNNIITSVGIFDYEFDLDQTDDFFEGDFILTSAYFAKDDYDKLDQIIRIMAENKVGCLAIKSVYFDSLRPDTQRFCEQHHFPVLFHDKSIYMEDIIFSIRELLQNNALISSSQYTLEQFIETKSYEQALKLYQELKLKGEGCVSILYLDHIEPQQEHRIIKKIRNIKEAYFSYFKTGLLCIMTYDHLSENVFLKTLQKILQQLEYEHPLKIGSAQGTLSCSGLQHTIREAYYACMVGEQPITSFKNMPLNRLYTHITHDPIVSVVAQNFIDSLNQHDLDLNTEYALTLKTYFNAEFSIEKTAVKLHQHANTIRYRIHKFHQDMYPDLSNHDFQTLISISFNYLQLKQLGL